MYTSDYIDSILIRALKSMLIISERIQSNFSYNYSDIYHTLKYKQRDIYILYKTLSDNKPYRAVLEDYDALVSVLASKCGEVDAYNSEYDNINYSYQNISTGYTPASTGYVPYSGATSDVLLGNHQITLDQGNGINKTTLTPSVVQIGDTGSPRKIQMGLDGFTVENGSKRTSIYPNRIVYENKPGLTSLTVKIPDTTLTNNIITWPDGSGTVALTSDIQSPTGVVSASSSLMMNVDNEHYVFTGTTGTWTLPVVTGNTWKRFFIKNRGSGTLTVNSNSGGNDIFISSAVNSFTRAVGEASIIVNDGTYWNLE